ncbi:MAG: tRNA pseudouridine(55) synthase TruB [Bacilli bacterium]
MDGILLVNKPIGKTSRDVVNALMKKFNTKKMGHTGTLDPFASGVLLISVGKGTKISSYVEGLDKEYIAELCLGKDTDTLDLEGAVIEEKEIKLPLERKQIEEVLSSFVGEIKQIPPMYSALKIGGEELYKKARRGEVIERKERLVTIHSLSLLSIYENKIIFKVCCSKGTYIRTLGNDIAHRLGTCGHLTMLTRTRVGKYIIERAKNVEDITEDDIYSIEDALSYMSQFIVSGDYEKKVLNGVSLYLNSDDLVLVKDVKGKALAIYKKEEDGKHHCLRGLL